jgi:hypothetical protein
VAATALTIGVAVVLPSTLVLGGRDQATPAAARAVAPAPIEVAIVPARIDVVAERTPSVAKGTGRPAAAMPVKVEDRQAPGHSAQRAKST